MTRVRRLLLSIAWHRKPYSDVCGGPESSTSDVAQINEPPKAFYKLNPNVFSVRQLLAHEIQSKQSTSFTKDAVEAGMLVKTKDEKKAFEKQGAEKRKAKAGAR
ncbi:hypothetical protein M422DRAFT_263569 [Sphaerobolus stellatus SS14]|uniref:Uncharacterized protein n=1 Tax=Sphaerobolus stellatus (strain SS14) TaxID=990650 RepID=A0A0C9UHW6_SPHS4|nr:hypothetical protein M422DRAFT_263569 [Sphaerobolus stellatus SS14]